MEGFLVFATLIGVGWFMLCFGYMFGHDAGYRLRDSQVSDPFEDDDDDDDDWGDDDEYWEPTEDADEQVSGR